MNEIKQRTAIYQCRILNENNARYDIGNERYRCCVINLVYTARSCTRRAKPYNKVYDEHWGYPLCHIQNFYCWGRSLYAVEVSPYFD